MSNNAPNLLFDLITNGNVSYNVLSIYIPMKYSKYVISTNNNIATFINIL